MSQPRLTTPAGAPEEALRAELEELNGRLKVLRSSDFALRAYLVAWAAFVSCSVAVKLTWDWVQTEAKPPMLAVPLALLGLFLAFDAVRSKVRQRRLARDEEKELARQRELRRLLGIDEAPFARAGSTGA